MWEPFFWPEAGRAAERLGGARMGFAGKGSGTRSATVLAGGPARDGGPWPGAAGRGAVWARGVQAWPEAWREMVSRAGERFGKGARSALTFVHERS